MYENMYFVLKFAFLKYMHINACVDFITIEMCVGV